MIRPRPRDGILAFAALAVQLVLLAHGGFGLISGHHRALDLDGGLLAALSALPLVLWRTNVLAVFVTTTLASCTLNLLHYPPGPPIGATIAVFIFATTTAGMKRRALALVGLLLAGHVASVGIAERSFPTLPLVFGIVVWTLAVVIGDRARLRREQRAALEQHARAEERTRIARDLHDSVGHAINVILVQAGAARLLRESDPARSHTALETIEHVARQTVGEIDELVRTLRDGEHTNGRIETQPGLAALDTLTAQHRLAGLDVTVRHTGTAHAVPTRVDQAAYRILQEALTNATRHGTGSAQIDITYANDQLELTIRNQIRPDTTTGDGRGHGIVGMRERAELLAGSLTAETRVDRFIVHATLPTPVTTHA